MSNTTSNQASSSTGKIRMFMLSSIAALGFGIGAGAVNALQFNQQPESGNRYYQQEHTMDKYERLEMGDSLKETELLLGNGVEESRSDTQVNMIWKNEEGSYIKLVFQDDALISREQSGLLDSRTCSL